MRFVSVAALTAASALLAACSTPATPTTRFVHDSVLVDYSPAANMGDVLDGWAACQKGSQRWSESTREDGAVVVRFECRAKDLLELNQTIADKSKTIRLQIYTISCTALHPVVHAAEFFTPAADSSIEFFF